MEAHARPFVIGIAGGSGSGKSTVARALLEWYAPGVVLLAQDCYYRDHPELSPEQRAALNYDEPAALDHPLLLSQMRALVEGQPVQRPRYNFSHHRREHQTDLVRPARVLLMEGLFALWDPEIRRLLDLGIFVAAASDLRFIRRLSRDVSERGRTVESVIQQYLETVRPMHQAWVEPTRRHAHVVLENTGSLEALEARLEQELASLPVAPPLRRRPDSAGQTAQEEVVQARPAHSARE